ncbi:MAG: RrF2 family transcriptional regulator [Acidobacteriota bacterium]
MLGKTSISAIRALLFLAQQREDGWWSPRRLAAELGESPTYLAKILRQLVKAGILDVARGVHGGVHLARNPRKVTLLAVVEACQGALVGNYCRSGRESSQMCGFHQAALELHKAIENVLARWTLARLLEKPEAHFGRKEAIPCLMQGVAVTGCRSGCRKAPLKATR